MGIMSVAVDIDIENKLCVKEMSDLLYEKFLHQLFEKVAEKHAFTYYFNDTFNNGSYVFEIIDSFDKSGNKDTALIELSEYAHLIYNEKYTVEIDSYLEDVYLRLYFKVDELENLDINSLETILIKVYNYFRLLTVELV